ncbi:MAG TPA: hypothetical protein VJT31_25940 [Rugosimonospora sp.]|nr:hypothetical protein [Rugosimonospora sp.]
MSADDVESPDPGTIDAALRGIRDILAADGYELAWSMEEQNRVGIRVVAGPAACADCLVPPPLMRSIVDGELGGTGYRVGSITLPATSSATDHGG